MIDELYLRMIYIHPIRFLSTGYKMNFSNPGRKLLHAPKPVFQKTVISEARYGYFVFGVINFTRILCKFLLPLRVVHIHPGYYKVYIHKHYVSKTTIFSTERTK